MYDSYIQDIKHKEDELAIQYLPAVKAMAFMRGKDFVTPVDVAYIAKELMRHRIVLTYEAEAENITTDIIIEKIIENDDIDKVYAMIVTQKNSQKGMIIGQKGKKIKEVGVVARKLLESFSGKKIYLELYVKTIPNWDERKIVTIKGEVKYPGVYVIKKGEKLADVIKRAGGFTKNAYLYGAVFTRESIKRMQEKRLKNMIYKLKKKVAIIAASAKEVGQKNLNAKDLMDAIDNLAIQAEKLKPIGRIAIKLDRNLTKFENSPYDITLENNDTLYIPTKPDSVIVMGEVLTPSAFVYTTDSALKYIKLAGGKTSVADDIYFVVHANGFTDKGEFGRWFNDDIKVKPGDAITIPIQIKTATWYGIAKDITAIVYQLAITSASLKTVGAF